MARCAAAGAIILLILGIPAPALAFVPRGGDTVIISDPLQDDLYVGAQTIEIRAPIDGDVVAAGYRITISAPVTGAVLAAGATVDLESRVDRSVRAAGRRVTVAGTVGTDAVLAGATVRVLERAQIGRDLVALGGRIRHDGAVARGAFFNGGRVVIAGTISGNVEVTADTLIVAETARIGGRLTYSVRDNADIRQGAQISGGIERRVPPPARRRVVSPFGISGVRWLPAVVETVWLLVLGFVALAISARGVFAVADRIRRGFWISLLGGLVLAVLIPIAAVLLFITLLGIPLGGIALLLYAATLYPATIFTAAWLGERIVPPLRGSGPARAPYLTMLVGVIAVVALMALPIVGWIFRAAAVLVGFGALSAKVWAARSAPPADVPAGAPPPAGTPGGG